MVVSAAVASMASVAVAVVASVAVSVASLGSVVTTVTVTSVVSTPGVLWQGDGERVGECRQKHEQLLTNHNILQLARTRPVSPPSTNSGC